MKKLYIFLAEGFEEIEFVAVLDVLRRANLDTKSVSITDAKQVTGAHGISVLADMILSEIDITDADMLILPGGMPGTRNLNACIELKKILKTHAEKGKDLAAICAAPMILGQLGLLEGKEATCYPGNEQHLKGAKISEYMIVQDEHIITAAGPGVALDFALQIVEYYLGEERTEELSKTMLLS